MATGGKTHSVSVKALPDIATMERNIESVYRLGNYNGITDFWYKTANDTARSITFDYGLPLEYACGIIAALSPSLSWDKNVSEAQRLIGHYLEYGYAPNSCIAYPANVLKAIRILDGESPDSVLGGDKVRSFYRNILQPDLDNVVTIDRHAIAIALYGLNSLGSDTTALVPTKNAYSLLAQAYRNVAQRYGVVANVVQSVTWVVLTSSQSGRGK